MAGDRPRCEPAEEFQMEPVPLFGDPVGPWHRWFAWCPVDTFDGGYRWLSVVWRRRIEKHHYLPGGVDRWWQYRRWLAVAKPPAQEKDAS